MRSARRLVCIINNPSREVAMKRHHWRELGFALAALPLLSAGAAAQLAVSANDNKAVLVDGVNSVPDNPAADTVSIIDLGAKPPKVIAEVKAPASVVGPPQSVAVSRDESYALVTGAMKLDPADPKNSSPMTSCLSSISRPSHRQLFKLLRQVSAPPAFRSTAPARWRWSPTAAKVRSRYLPSQAINSPPPAKFNSAAPNRDPHTSYF